MTIYIDKDFKCYATNDGTMRGFDVPFFDGKCPEFIEGYRYIPDGETWMNENGDVFPGEAYFPWKNSQELERIQMQYERELLSQLKADLADADAALAEVGVIANG